MSVQPAAADLFAEAAASFRSTLPEAEQKELRLFRSKDEMLQQVKSVYKDHRDSSRFMRCCSKIAIFANAFEPYFEIINVFVQVKPEYMGLIWGSIRLIFKVKIFVLEVDHGTYSVLKLASNHVGFLEKVSDLFELISLSLPRYKEQYELCRRRNLAHVDMRRVTEIMRIVYRDIISFCGEICLILCRRPKTSGFKQNLRLFRDAVWMPFDVRFRKLQESLHKNQGLFEQEMQLQDAELLTQHYEDVQRYLEEHKMGRDDEKLRESARRIRELDRRLDGLQQWIWNSDHKTIYEKAQRNRYPGSCDWLLSKATYREWRDRSFQVKSAKRQTNIGRDVFEKLLFLSGKPGFGKTLLSSLVIEDLSYHIVHDAVLSTVQPAVAYFHFSQSIQHGNRNSSQALRALTSQLVAQRRSEASVADALLILFCKFSHDQRHASSKEIEAVLRLLIQSWPTFLVIDGIDECVDSDEFLTGLWSIIFDLDCRIVLLGRPDLEFPRVFNSSAGKDECGQWFWEMQLTKTDNLSAIQSYLSGRLANLVSDGLFGNVSVGEDIINKLSSRSNGMFLWAALLIGYLECPALSPQERVTIVREVNLIEGLESLYYNILDTLSQKYRRQIIVAADTFQWLSFSIYQLRPEELRYALAIKPGETTDDSSLLSNFPRCLQQITMSLVEVELNGTVGFVHSSFKEFLESSPRCHSTFSLRNPKAVHGRMSATCISYILRDIPSEPLRRLERDICLELGVEICGVEARWEERLQPGDHRAHVLQKHPFLRYASLFWAAHLVQFFSTEDNFSKQAKVAVQETQRQAKMKQKEHYPTTYRTRLSASAMDDQSHPQLSNSYETPDHIKFDGMNRQDAGLPQSLRSMGLNMPQVRDTEWQQTESSSGLDTLISLLSELLVSRASVTAWVEACWTFTWAPNLTRLEPHLRHFAAATRLDTSLGREIHWISAGAHQLSEALVELSRRHHDKLINNPTLIWQSQIVAATDTSFWPIFESRAYDGVEESADPVTVPAGSRSQSDMSAGPSNVIRGSLPIVM